LFGLRSAPERPIEHRIRRRRIFEPEDLRDSGERPAFVAQYEGLLVTIHFVRYIRGALVRG
ncbi:MAG TPA: hypothetical protein VNG12_15235, partial [Acidimicrobiales bacterium]|nr:hypothetical protein [Acidimicrobiales bacterium]